MTLIILQSTEQSLVSGKRESRKTIVTFYNIYRQYPLTKKILYYYKETSVYSFEVGKNELISEILVKHNSNPAKFTEEMIKLLRKRCDI